MSDSESADPHSPSPTGDGQDTEPRDADGHEVARRGDTEAMEGLLEQGMDPNHTNEHGHSLLMIAAYSDQPEMADLLIEHGADPTTTNEQGQTAAEQAAAEGHEEIAERLRQATAGA
ncbi:ankyrin repeat domain-containing protein [Salinibacter ruber]|uniref:ankyrin repeat domain-containing protein n=1 Tax=Salinibacter ruber TaxID=146919 RepID=UPI002074800C|nr:ankyrin repeat domain-containing protein [Salinibacter ruber]